MTYYIYNMEKLIIWKSLIAGIPVHLFDLLTKKEYHVIKQLTVETNRKVSLGVSVNSTHFAWTRDTTDHSSHCTLVHGRTRGWITMDKPEGDLRVILFWPVRVKQNNPIEPCQPITGLEKCPERRGEREKWHEESPPLHRAALKKEYKSDLSICAALKFNPVQNE